MDFFNIKGMCRQQGDVEQGFTLLPVLLCPFMAGKLIYPWLNMCNLHFLVLVFIIFPIFASKDSSLKMIST